MKKILFIRSEKAYLPEIDAYTEYFNKTSEFEAYDSTKIESSYDLNDFDIVWEFKGIGGAKSKNQFIVHEYSSLSTSFFPKGKNLVKKTINPKPNLRVFLNKSVKDEMNFKDKVEFCYRDMGIDKSFIYTKSNKKDYEFVYIGSMAKGRGIDRMLKAFTQNKNGRLCLIGNPPDELFNEYKSNRNIVFTGKVGYKDVPQIASRAVYGINYIPDKYPYNIQTSTKILEYLALGLNIITTDYRWVRDFEKENDCSFYKLSGEKFDIDEIINFEFKSEFKPEEYLWDVIIDKSKIKEKLLYNF